MFYLYTLRSVQAKIRLVLNILIHFYIDLGNVVIFFLIHFYINLGNVVI